MKKLLIAAAAMAVVAGAQAQSNVTIYGGFDASYSNDERGTNAVSNNQMSNKSTDYFKTSAFGIRGTEDLGGGLSASFQWESDLDSAIGTTTLGDRLSFVTLASKEYGALSMGRQNDAVKDIEGLSQVYNLSDNLHFNTLVGNRYANVIKYQSPDISGFKFAYSTSDNPAADSITQTGTGSNTSSTQEANNTLRSFNIQYKIPFNGGIDVAYGSGKVQTGAATVTETETNMFTARTVVMGATVGAAYIKNEQTGGNKLDQTIVSVNVPLKGKYDLKAHYVTNKQTGSVITTPTGASANKVPEGNAYGGDGYGVMGVYNLSKRTAAYIGYADFSADTAAGDRKVSTVGLHHAF
jgi:predicted porin